MIRQKLNSAFCTFEDWHPHVPPELQNLSEADWMARSRAMNWAAYVKINGQRSKPYWRKRDVLAWFKLRFSKVFPSCVASLVAAGFEEPSQPKTKEQMRRGF